MQSENKKKLIGKILSGLMLGLMLVLSSPLAHAQDAELPLYEPIEKQIIQLTDEGSLEGWKVSKLETYGIKFLIRGKEALTWTLNIEDGGFHNPAIEKSYSKVLTIVNSLFILGLLAIAGMWMFSTIIPRKHLKKVILIYSLAVIFVNFALPVNQLFIDGTNLLQKTLLVGSEGNIKITDIVQTPAYSDAVSYRNESPENLIQNDKTLTLDLPGEGISVPVGTISSPSIGSETIGMTANPINLKTSDDFSVFEEQTVFRFVAMSATALAYLLIALIFVLRIIILWALLILSPILLLLAIFRSTRGWFINWLTLYGRWLLIGPLTALGIAVIVNIWQMSGLPIQVSETYSPEVFSAIKDSNIVFYLPGKDTANTLSNTQEMMEYLVFIIMLYLPVFMAFALTRRKALQAGAQAISKKILSNTQTNTSQSHYMETRHEEEIHERESSIIGSIKNMVSEKIGLLTEDAMPFNKLQTQPEKPTKLMESAHNFLPDKLMNTPIPKILELLGKEKGSKESHTKVIERLANIESIKNTKEREQVQNALNEIQQKAGERDREAMTIMHEIETFKELESFNTENIEKEKTAETNSNSTIINNVKISESESKPDEKQKEHLKHRRHRHHHKKKKAEDKNEKVKDDGKEKESENTSNPPVENAN